MARLLTCAWITVLAAAFMGGCQKQQTASLDDPIAPAPIVYEEKKDGPLDGLAFWNWGKGEDQITADDVLKDMSPELTTRAETRDEGRIRTARVFDTDSRGAWDDLARILLQDRPSRLSLYPTP